MTTALEVLAGRGIATTDVELAALVQAAVDEIPLGGAVGLPENEAGVYDAAGMSADEGLYRRQIGARAARYATLIGSALPVAESAEVLGLSRARVQQMISAGEVWAVRNPKGRWVLPRLQFSEGRLLPGWARIARALPSGLHPLEVLGLLTTPQPELVIDGTPVMIVDWLLAGEDPDVAVRIAAGSGELAG